MKTSHPWVYICEISVCQGLRQDLKNFQRGRKTNYPSMKNFPIHISVLLVLTLDAISIAS